MPVRGTKAFSAYLVTVAVATVAAGGVRADSAALTVRLYNTAGIPAPDLTAARRAAESILLDTGLTVTIRHCGRTGSPGAPVEACDTRLTATEVVVRIIDAPPFTTTLHADAYGVAYVVDDTDRGWLATVFADRIARAATRAGIDPGTLLGRVMAHEVGHLLLGSRYHAAAGVMRGEWPDAVLSGAGSDWRFSLLESRRMHRLLVSDEFDPS